MTCFSSGIRRSHQKQILRASKPLDFWWIRCRGSRGSYCLNSPFRARIDLFWLPASINRLTCCQKLQTGTWVYLCLWYLSQTHPILLWVWVQEIRRQTQQCILDNYNIILPILAIPDENLFIHGIAARQEQTVIMTEFNAHNLVIMLR
jgi:hypothetical protein